MKTSHAIAAPAFTASKPGVSLATRASRLFADIVSAWRAAAEERHVRRQLAELDDAMLRDIGIAPDEIARVRAEQKFTPRGWTQRVARQDAWHV
jgi:uncharacterized protein YjiS (DUF1127 family)